MQKDEVYLLKNKEKLKNAINDARVLRLPDHMIKELTQMNEQVLWRDECDQLWYRITNERAEWWSSQSSSEEEVKKVNMKEIDKVVSEGRKKGFKCERLFELWESLDGFTLEIQAILESK